MFLRNWARLYAHQTAPELVFERLICTLGKPYRAQHPFFGYRRIVDFALPQEKILIEIDGSSHSVPAQTYKDITSTIIFENIGWRVIRFTNAEVMGWPDEFDLQAAIDDRLIHRPTLSQLETQLASLPKPVSKPRKQKKARPRGKVRSAKVD